MKPRVMVLAVFAALVALLIAPIPSGRRLPSSPSRQAQALRVMVPPRSTRLPPEPNWRYRPRSLWRWPRAFLLYMVKAVMNGRTDEIADLAKTKSLALRSL
jgi:hypothetical protein